MHVSTLLENWERKFSKQALIMQDDVYPGKVKGCDGIGFVSNKEIKALKDMSLVGLHWIQIANISWSSL